MSGASIKTKMTSLSYNEEIERKTIIRHFFVPPLYGFISELVVAVVALILFNISQLSSQIAAKDFGTTNPLSLWSQLLNKTLTGAQQHNAVQEILLFSLWAIVGALIYILIFRLTQLFLATRSSVDEGIRIMETGDEEGLMRWLASLHNFFLRALTVIVALMIMAAGALICFSIASQELTSGLATPFPAKLWPLLISAVGAVLSVRLAVIGLSLLSRRFRVWYND